MKAAKYETSTGVLAAYLAAKPEAAILCDLYTFVPAGAINGGEFLAFTTSDVDVTVPYANTGAPLVNTGPPLPPAPTITGPVTYSSKMVYFDQLMNKAYGHWKIGLDVDTWQVICTPSPQATIGNQGFLAALRAGALDGAVVAVDRAFIDNRDGFAYASSLSPLGVVNVFTGRVAEIDLGRSNAVISINSHLELLNQNMPRNLYQASCRWQLFSAGCTLSAASFAVGGTVTTAPSANSNQLSATVSVPNGSRTYNLGHIVMTSGNNAGYARQILSWTPGSPATLNLRAPFPFALLAGDTFSAYPGCDKQQNTCIAFGNVANFGGMPFIPVPELAV
jgi:hypothetical protein